MTQASQGANGAMAHYSVEGEPGTWTTHSTLDEAIARARALGLTQVWGVRYGVSKSGSSSVDRRVVWTASDGDDGPLSGTECAVTCTLASHRHDERYL